MACSLKSKFHYTFILIWCSQVKYWEDVLPAWADVCSLRIYHLSYAAYNHVTNSWRSKTQNHFTNCHIYWLKSIFTQELILCNLSEKDFKKFSSLPIYLFLFMICSNGLKKSFWNRKLASSPFSKNFIDNCLKESTAKIATSSLGLQPT